ncbi:MAG: response regulator transcription factor [Pseudomonadota bacterium]|nr:response regulator transcription factor [Pseudomonadota bacterium]
MTFRVLLVDENNLFRKGLASLISTDPGFEVVGDLGGGKEALHASLQLEPDIVLMDVQLAGINGLEIGAQLKRRQPNIRIVLLTSLKSEEHVRAALRFGADGYILKDASFEELMISLRSVAAGKKYLSPDVSAQVVDSFLRPSQARHGSSRLEALTARERSILQLVAEGRTNRGAASFLNVSPKTVEKHRASLMHKLGLRNAAELTLAALDLGLIERPNSVARLSSGLLAGSLVAEA